MSSQKTPPDASPSWQSQIDAGARFAFGDNWTRYLRHLDAHRVERARNALSALLDQQRLDGLRFLDIGSGSGIHSLAARQLGAKVESFDFDDQSVACTRLVRERFATGDSDWRVGQGSVLDASFLSQLVPADVVYSWGVLHHTGSMWQAIANAAQLVRPGGRFVVALYNDQGWISGYWKHVKQVYNRNRLGAWAMILVHAPYLVGARFLVRLLTGRLDMERGMTLWYDMLDWLGGLPFEVADRRAVEAFMNERGFTLVKVVSAGRRHGCNEFVFHRVT